jgi:hypothetical protein
MKKTDWDSYYSHPYRTATYSRNITSNKLLRLLKKFAHQIGYETKIVELGGANSCFYEAIDKELSPIKYLIVDNNLTGLDKTKTRLNKSDNIEFKYEDVLNTSEAIEKYDIVFSVGLIEHFSIEETKKCIASHFCYLKSKGTCIISFPTPTWLYKITRKCAELFGLWIFYDERPLKMDDVLNEIRKYGVVMHSSITWPIFLTQGIIVVIKN